MSEPIPSAIARGPDAATPGAISPMRTGIGAGILAAIFVITTFAVAQVPDRALSIVGGDPSEAGRYGGMRIVWVPPPGADLAQVERTFHDRHRGGRVSRDGDAFVVEVGHVSREEVERSAKLLSSGGLSFHRTVITEAMPQLAQGFGFEIGEEATQRVHLEIDQWMPEDGSQRMTDFYLIGDSKEQIEAALAEPRARGWALPEGTRLAYELVEPWSGREDRRPFWRSHVIEIEAAISGARIYDAAGSYDPNTNRPIILLDFDREGAVIFGDVTASMIGHKLATVLGGDVKSAPIINGPIRGGRASITMGGSDPIKQEQERDALVGVLRVGAMPPGGTLREASYISPSVTALQEWLARALLALFGALLVGLVTWALVRKTRPVWRTPEVRMPGSVAWVRVAVMLAAPIVVIGASLITAPGIDSEQVMFAMGDDSQLSLGMLGISPLLTSFVLVELVATIVPRWRRRRHAGPSARLAFDIATLVLAAVFSLIQAWFTASYLERIDAAPLGLERLLFLASIVGMTCVFAFVAWIIRVYGAGNGYAALLVTGFALNIYHVISPARSDFWAATTTSTGDLVVVFVTTVVFAIAIGCVLRWRISHAGQVPLRVPTSGVAPIAEAQGMLALVVAALGALPLGALSLALNDAQLWMLDLHRAIGLATIVVFAVFWSWAFARPRALAGFAERANLARPSMESWRMATLLSVGLLAVLATGYVVVDQQHSLLGVVPAAIIAALALDAYDDIRGRRGRLAYVWSLQSAQHADIAAHVLEKEQIAFHLAGTNLRTAFAWFGPFAPIDIWVRREDVSRTKEVLASVFAK